MLAGFYFEFYTNDDERQLHWLTEILMDWLDQVPFVGVLILLMFLDIVTGVIAAAIEKKVDSDFSFRGILKKVQMLIMVGAGLIFELVYPDIPWGKLIAGLFTLNEMLSIVENAGRAGLPLPRQLVDTLAQLKKQSQELTPRVEIQITDNSTHSDDDNRTTHNTYPSTTEKVDK